MPLEKGDLSDNLRSKGPKIIENVSNVLEE
jgi:hypothetical protein